MRARVWVCALAALLAAAVPASAHVDVIPGTVVQGTATEFTVRVPTERPLATTAVSIGFPDQVTVYSFAPPPPGWTAHPRLSADGTYTGVVYRGESGVDRYVSFRFLATPFTAGRVTFPVRQTYADGKVKPWTGPPETAGTPSAAESGPEDPGPSAAVEVLPEGTAVGATAAAGQGDDDSGAAVWLGVIAIAVSAMAALGVGLLWSTRPARLPPDDEEGT